MRLVLLLLISQALCGQPKRDVVLTWVASISNGVLGYNVYRGDTAAGPFTLLNDALITGVTFTDMATVGNSYTYHVRAVAQDCTPTTPVDQPCGTSDPAVATTNVPIKPEKVVTITVLVR